TGVDQRVMVVRAAQRFCRIAYRLVAGRQVFRHPSCRERHYILEKLSIFYAGHETPLEQVLCGLKEAINWLPPGEHAAESERLRAAPPSGAGGGPSSASAPPGRAARAPLSTGRRPGPRPP